MTPADQKYLSELVKVRSGLVLSEEKAYLIESRLGPLARQMGLDGLDQLFRSLRDQPTERLLSEVTEAMTTNESFFFRDKTPFEHLEKVVLPELLERQGGAKQLRIWCAAASNGQEPYSIAMILKGLGAKLNGWNVEILATDIAKSVLERAKQGTYSQFEVQRGLPIQLLVKHFEKQGENWRVKADLRSMVKFREFNLLDDYRGLGRFDIVFCRNVLIYFDRDTKQNVLERIRATMPDEGFLVLGAAETVLGITDVFGPMAGHRGLYRPQSGAAAATGPALKRAAG